MRPCCARSASVACELEVRQIRADVLHRRAALRVCADRRQLLGRRLHDVRVLGHELHDLRAGRAERRQPFLRDRADVLHDLKARPIARPGLERGRNRRRRTCGVERGRRELDLVRDDALRERARARQLIERRAIDAIERERAVVMQQRRTGLLCTDGAAREQHARRTGICGLACGRLAVRRPCGRDGETIGRRQQAAGADECSQNGCRNRFAHSSHHVSYDEIATRGNASWQVSAGWTPTPHRNPARRRDARGTSAGYPCPSGQNLCVSPGGAHPPRDGANVILVGLLGPCPRVAGGVRRFPQRNNEGSRPPSRSRRARRRQARTRRARAWRAVPARARPHRAR